jgi:hypothetical protein
MMSPVGTFRTWRDVRLESAFGEERKLDFGAVRSVGTHTGHHLAPFSLVA